MMRLNFNARQAVKNALVKVGLGKESWSQVMTDSAGSSSATYWTGHNVTNHHMFESAKDSIEYFDWRNRQYFNYIELMPVTGQEGKIVLDFGCGPGHDLVGFLEYSKPQKIYGVDVSSSSLAEARSRVSLHSKSSEVELIHLTDGVAIPLADHSVDFIHSSGVLHHVEDLQATLRELRRILKPDGKMQVMVYNYNSLWVHLYVAYHLQIYLGKYSEMSIRDAFRKTTDGEFCPISNCYKPEEFIAELKKAGFSEASYRGAGISAFEMTHLPSRLTALMEQRLGVEHRKFLYDLTFDSKGLPLHDGHVAGIDAVFNCAH